MICNHPLSYIFSFLVQLQYSYAGQILLIFQYALSLYYVLLQLLSLPLYIICIAHPWGASCLHAFLRDFQNLTIL